MMNDHTLVEYFNDHEGYKCGYCKSKTTSFNRGMWAHSLDVVDYQGLIDRGWRRSGQYCYKPTMAVTCCPLYGIRCHANNFKPSKSQKKVMRKMRQFLVSGGQEDIDNWKKSCEARQSHDPPDDNVNNVAQNNTPARSKDVEGNSDSMQTSTLQTVDKPKPAKGKGADPSKPKPKKAKQLRMERKKEKLQKKGVDPSTSEVKPKPGSQEKTLEELLPHLNPPENAKHKLEVRLVQSSPRTHDFSKSKQESYEIYKRYQMAIHGDHPSDCHDKQWSRFLVDSPLNAEDRLFSPGFGSFHNQYWLDDKLIAVGVLDILPNYISSVYVYYNPDYGFLSLGVYTALSELVLTRKFHDLCPSIEYYCMGYFVESCQKMRYKLKFFGSEILCPETYRWVLAEKCVETLKKTKYARLNVLDGGSPDDKDLDGEWENLDDVLCLYRRVPTRYVDYQHHKWWILRKDELCPPTPEELEAKKEEESEKIRVYAKMAGKKCATRMLLFRSEAEDYY